MSPVTLQIALKHAVDDLGVDVLKSPTTTKICLSLITRALWRALM